MDLTDQGYLRAKLAKKLKSKNVNSFSKKALRACIDEILKEEPIIVQGINIKEKTDIMTYRDEPESMVQSSAIGHGGQGVDTSTGDVPAKSASIGKNAQHMLRDLGEDLNSSGIGKGGAEDNFPGGDIPAKPSGIGKAEQSVAQAHP